MSFHELTVWPPAGRLNVDHHWFGSPALHGTSCQFWLLLVNAVLMQYPG